MTWQSRRSILDSVPVVCVFSTLQKERSPQKKGGDVPMIIAIDLNGGDNSPDEVIKGIKLAIKSGYVLPDEILAFGNEKAITMLGNFPDLRYVNCRVCSETIGMGDKVAHFDRKKDCSLVRGLTSLKDNECDVFISAGNTAAIVSLAVMILGRINRRVLPAIGVVIPSEQGHCLLIDVGANANSSAHDLLNNAKMAHAYSSKVLKVDNPKVGLLNIGVEIGKGHKEIHPAHDLMSKNDINFIGNVEGDDIFTADVDIVVTDGFTGNIILKSSEGLIRMIYDLVKKELANSKLYYFALVPLIFTVPFLYPVFKSLKAKLDYNEYGGALLLGVNGNVIIAHGKSKDKAISKAIRTATLEAKENVSEAILEEFSKHKKIPEE